MSQRNWLACVMTDSIPTKKPSGLPPWFGAFTPTKETSHMMQYLPVPRCRGSLKRRRPPGTQPL
jgi:hypothetical protein